MTIRALLEARAVGSAPSTARSARLTSVEGGLRLAAAMQRAALGSSPWARMLEIFITATGASGGALACRMEGVGLVGEAAWGDVSSLQSEMKARRAGVGPALDESFRSTLVVTEGEAVLCLGLASLGSLDDPSRRAIVELATVALTVALVRSERDQWAARHGQVIALLDHLRPAIMGLAIDGRLLEANGTASELLRRGDVLTLRDGRISAKRPAETERLRQLVWAGCGIRGASLASATGERLLVLVVGLTTPLRERGIHALLVACHPARTDRPPVDLLRDIWDLTDAEATLLVDLLQGKRLDVAARQRQRSVETVRTHLKHVFGKTGTTRQAELMRVVASSLCLIHLGDQSARH